MEKNLFMPTSSLVSSKRIIYTPSSFARASLLYLQEVGTLKALHPHKSERSGLNSFLFFTVLSGSGRVVYDGKRYDLTVGDCVFIDCKKSYSHETGYDAASNLWALSWCHFYGSNMNAIYHKYLERGGRPVFKPHHLDLYTAVLDDLYKIANSSDYVRDMRINEKLSSLLILLMEDAWEEKISASVRSESVDIHQVKEYLDINFKQKISLDELSSHFFINKYYLLSLFKERYGITINAYLNQMRVTYIKQQLRFTAKTVEDLAVELHIEPTYLSRLFKKTEGMSPSEYRRKWSG